MAANRQTRLNRERRRLMVAKLDAERVPYGDIVRMVSEQWGCSERTVKGDIAKVYAERKVALKEQAAGNLTNGIGAAKTEIRRLRSLLKGSPDAQGQPTRELDDNAHFRYSMALLRWEQHLLKLQGVLVGRLEVSVNSEPMTPVCTIPSGPFGDAGAITAADISALPEHVSADDPRL